MTDTTLMTKPNPWKERFGKTRVYRGENLIHAAADGPGAFARAVWKAAWRYARICHKTVIVRDPTAGTVHKMFPPHGPTKTFARERIEWPPRMKLRGVSMFMNCYRAAEEIFEWQRRIRAETLLTTEHKLYRHLLCKAVAEIRRRQLETPAGFWSNMNAMRVRQYDKERRLWTIAGWWYHEYADRRRGVRVGYLAGVDDGHPWAVRIPYTVAFNGIDTALEWLKPKEIRIAEKKGLPVKRQGDIYFVKDGGDEAGKAGMYSLIGTRHKANRTKRGWTIRHPEHKTVFLNGHGWSAYLQKQLGYANQRVDAD